MYDDATETEKVDMGDTEIVTFTTHFKCLERYVSYHLHDDH